jgi:site-specific DNA-methyltransferase (adenine-specific)
MKGFHNVLREGSLLAYLVSIALRLTEIHRVLKPEGTFYFHCDPTAGHYLKVLMDTIFSGRFRNEIIWCYAGGGIPKNDFPRKHDTIFRYSKGDTVTYNPIYRDYSPGTVQRGRTAIKGKYFDQGLRAEGTPVNDWWADVPKITSPTDPEKLGFPTQKSEALMDRIIAASSNEGDVVLDAYCGCGTTVAVAQRMKRAWIGIDITYQSISLVLRRLEKAFGAAVVAAIKIDGVPRDMASAEALAHRKDDRLRKEFEKWAVLTYTNNRAVVNEKKGADAGIDATGYFMTGKGDNAKVIFQVKSGGVKRGDIATLRGDMGREKAALAVLITLEEPSKPMMAEAKAAGQYRHETMGRSYDQISIVTVREIVEDGKRLDIPMSLEVLAAAKRAAGPDQIDIPF